jgi:hypothetical protein
MTYTIETATHRGLRIDVEQDTDAESPRTAYDNTAVIACRDDHRYYELGDADASFDLADFESWADVKAYLVAEHDAHPDTFVGLGLIDHSGLHLRVGLADGQTPDTWDGNFIGWAYLTRAVVEAEVAPYWAPGNVTEKAREIAVSDAETYGSYLAGDACGYIVRDASGRVVDSCWGYWSTDEAVEQGKLAAEWHANRLEAELDRWVELCAGRVA